MRTDLPDFMLEEIPERSRLQVFPQVPVPRHLGHVHVIPIGDDGLERVPYQQDDASTEPQNVIESPRNSFPRPLETYTDQNKNIN